MALPAAAAAAYQSIANIGGASSAAPAAAAAAPGANFSDFLSGAVKDSINSISQGEKAASQPGQRQGQYRRCGQFGELPPNSPSIPWWRCATRWSPPISPS